MAFHRKLSTEIEQVIHRGSERLTLSYWSLNFGVEGAQEVKRALIDWRNEIRELFLWGNRLDHDEWIYLCEGLTNGNCKVEVLGLEENNFHSVETVKLLCKTITHANNRIAWLNLSGTQLCDPACLQQLALSLAHTNSQVQSIFLDGNQVDDEGVRVFCEALLSQVKISSHLLPSRPSPLQHISLRRNYLGCAGIIYLIELVKQFPVPLNINVLGNNNGIPLQHVPAWSPLLRMSTQEQLFMMTQDELKRMLRMMVLRRGSRWYTIVIALLSVRDIPRLGTLQIAPMSIAASTFKLLPKELIRRVAEALPIV